MRTFRQLVFLAIAFVISHSAYAQTVECTALGPCSACSSAKSSLSAPIPFLSSPERYGMFSAPQGVMTAQVSYEDTSTTMIIESFPSPLRYTTSTGTDTEAAKNGIEVRCSAPFASNTYLDSIRFYGAFPQFDSTLGSRLIVGAWPAEQIGNFRFANYNAKPYFEKQYVPSEVPVGTRGWFHIGVAHVPVDTDCFVSIFLTDTTGAAVMQIGLDSVTSDTPQVYDGGRDRMYWVLPAIQFPTNNATFTRYPGLFFHPNAYVIAYVSNANTGVSEPTATTQFRLEQNFPNPASGMTSIEYELADESPASLSLCDGLGREVETLLRNQIQSSGKHQLSFDASHLHSGIYYCILRSGIQQQVRAMQVVH